MPISNKDLLFHEWYPEYGWVFEKILRNNCTDEYDYYLNSEGTGKELSTHITPLIDCLLVHTSEKTMANMAAAGVLLGLLPTILALAGSSTAEMGILALKRPVLAFLLAVGGPAVTPVRTFTYQEPEQVLRMSQRSRYRHPPTGVFRVLLSLTQYLVACGAIVNVSMMAWELAIRTIRSWSPQEIFDPLLWTFISGAIHVGGAVAIRLRMRLIPNNTRQDSGRKSWWSTVNRHVAREATPCLCQSPDRLYVREETTAFVVLSWLLSTGIVLHIVYGTLTFSGTLFINTGDAMKVTARFLASTVACRIVLMHELSGIRQTVTIEQAVEDAELALIAK